jgi:putative IMPACT (imprinted ancient) family translation regulator
VVTRYFGGTLLGSGGLVRAYSKATGLALAAAGLEPDPEKAALVMTCRWENLDRVHRLVREYGGALLSSDYEASPTSALLEAELLAEDVSAFMSRFTDVTGGKDTVALKTE